MSVGSFGQQLGELILQKRRAAGLTQMQLAEDAYGSAAKTRRISELENGLVANPHPKTLDPLIVALKISDAELEECAKAARSRPDVALDLAYRDARSLMDAVAVRFEFARPDASLAELDEYLREKAAEYAALKSRLAAVELADGTLRDQLHAAEQALSRGDFGRVDELLESAEETFQQRRTLVEIGKQAEIRIMRGDASLLQGDAAGALSHYRDAAEFYRPFDLEAMALLLEDLAASQYELARRTKNGPFFISANLLEMLLELPPVQDAPERLATTHYRLSLVYRNSYGPGSPTLEAVERALGHAARAAAHRADNVFDNGSRSIALAHCLMDRARIENSAADVAGAIELYRTTKSAVSADLGVGGPLLGHVCNALGAALLDGLKLHSIDKADASREAISAFSEAVGASERYSDPEVWSVAKVNLGRLLAGSANSPGLEQSKRQFLRVRAAGEFLAAAEVYPMTLVPVHAAEIQAALAQLMWEQATDVDDYRAEVYLVRARQSCEMALHIFDEESHPLRWASLQFLMGRIFEAHAKFEGEGTDGVDVQAASACYESALKKFTQHSSQDAELCRSAITELNRWYQDITSRD